MHDGRGDHPDRAIGRTRPMGSGLFDTYPQLTIILGHMGEGLPYSMWRIDNRNAWVKAPPRYKAKRKIADYFHANFYLTTSGNFRTQSLIECHPRDRRRSDSIFLRIGPLKTSIMRRTGFDAASISANDR
jgi:gamma-resorcylate decarboxylase